LKVWNRNPVTGVVGVFNVQGSTFSRTRRNFHCHDDSPPTLSAVVRPTDVPTLFGNVSSIVHATYNNGAVDDFVAGAFCAMYSDGLKRLLVVDATEGEMQLTVPPAGSDVVVVSPVKECLGVLFAPIGLRDMLNAGGAVLSVSLETTEASDLERDFGGLCEATVRARGSGEFLCYASHRPVKVTVGNTGVDFQYEQSQGALSFVLDESHNGARECQVFF
jgi:raffinose synthase